MLIDKKDLPVVAMDFMNNVHYEDVEIINVLFECVLAYEKEANEANFDAINNQYATWYAHTVVHFEGEETKMLELNFPPYSMHKGEHDKALQRMDEVYQRWNQNKNIQILKMYLIEELPAWLVLHIQTMDTVTAMFFSTGTSACSAH